MNDHPPRTGEGDQPQGGGGARAEVTTPSIPHQTPINRIDRKLGMVWSRIGGTLFVLIGLAMLASALGSGDITDHWPLLLGTAVMFALARLAFRSRLGLSELLDDGPPGRKV